LFTPNKASPSYTLGNNSYIDVSRYLPVDLDSAENTLTVRAGFLKAQRTIPRNQWQFGRMVDGRIVPAKDALYLEKGF
jgi:hypothetical protein